VGLGGTEVSCEGPIAKFGFNRGTGTLFSGALTVSADGRVCLKTTIGKGSERSRGETERRKKKRKNKCE
jgi:hypothetical protein